MSIEVTQANKERLFIETIEALADPGVAVAVLSERDLRTLISVLAKSDQSGRASELLEDLLTLARVCFEGGS